MNKDKASYDLDSIKKAFDAPDKLRPTFKVRRSLLKEGFENQDVVDVIQALTPNDFYKTMPPEHEGFSAWHDVYKPCFKGSRLYIKFQVNNKKEFIVSFKRSTS